MAKKQRTLRPKRSKGDVFLIPLIDGTFVVGQIIGDEPLALNSTGVALFDDRLEAAELPEGLDLTLPRAFAILLVTPDLFKNGTWPIVGNMPIRLAPEDIPFNEYREKHWVGATVIGSGNVRQFANAFYGLEPWDDWHDPSYLDGLLLNSEKKPSRVRLKRNMR